MPRNVVSKTVAAVSDDDDSNEEPTQITEIELVPLVLASDRSNNNSDKAVAPAGKSKNRSSDKANSGLNSGPANVTHTKAKGNANDDSPDWSAAKTHGIGLLFKGLGIASGNSEESDRPIGRFAVKNPNAGVDKNMPAQSNKAGNAGDVVNPAFLAKNSSNPDSTKDTTFDASLNGHPRGNNLDFNVPNGKQLTAKAGNQNHDGNVSGTGNSLARNSKASEADSPSKTGNSNKNASVSPQSEGSNLNSNRGGRSNASDNKASTGSAPADKGNSSSGGEPKASVDSAPADQGNSSSAGEPKASVDSAPADKGNSSSAGEPKASVDSAPADKGNSSSAGEPRASVDSAPADKGNSSSAGSAPADPTPANDGNGNGGSTQNGNAPANEGNVDLVKKAGNTGNGKNG
ncbi:MAG: hypothetical protein O3A33_13885 [Chloroflexi bacterium]|nr:hypothetical protein [Chloroflexota bacterium]